MRQKPRLAGRGLSYIAQCALHTSAQHPEAVEAGGHFEPPSNPITWDVNCSLVKWMKLDKKEKISNLLLQMQIHVCPLKNW